MSARMGWMAHVDCRLRTIVSCLELQHERIDRNRNNFLMISKAKELACVMYQYMMVCLLGYVDQLRCAVWRLFRKGKL